MTDALQEIRMIPVDTITVLNPRARNKRVFRELVTNIANLGLKKPITVSEREDGSGYDLATGQGRLEAFIVLGEKEIPAVVTRASEEDCYVMSLVENLARVVQHVHHVRHRRALVAADVGDARLQQRLGDGKDRLAVEHLALAELELRHFLFEGAFQAYLKSTLGSQVASGGKAITAASPERSGTFSRRNG